MKWEIIVNKTQRMQTNIRKARINQSTVPLSLNFFNVGPTSKMEAASRWRILRIGFSSTRKCCSSPWKERITQATQKTSLSIVNCTAFSKKANYGKVHAHNIEHLLIQMCPQTETDFSVLYHFKSYQIFTESSQDPEEVFFNKKMTRENFLFVYSM